MTNTELREKLTKALCEHHDCVSRPHFIVICKRSFDLLHDCRSLDGISRVIKLTEEQVKDGLTPEEWSSVTRKIIKFQLETER